MSTLGPGVVLDSRYELTAALHDRGIGESWQARDREHGRLVGVKLLRALAQGAALPRELAEHLKALRAFRHDDVLAVINQGLHEARPYLVYDLFEGRSIGAALDAARADDSPLDLALVEAVFDRVCLTLHAAHRAPRPLLHLALTPGSVLYAGEGSALAVRVVDFGLARHAAPDPTAPLRSARVLSFPAPEQLAAGTPLGPATDVFSLGGLLRELLSLPAPLGMTLSPAGADRQREDVPEALWAVITRALAARPADRFPSVEAFRMAVAKAWRSPVRPKPAPAPAPEPEPVVEAAPWSPPPPVAAPMEVPVSGPMPAVVTPMAAFVSASALRPLAAPAPDPVVAPAPAAFAVPAFTTPDEEEPTQTAAALEEPDLGSTMQIESTGLALELPDAQPSATRTQTPAISDTQDLSEADALLRTAAMEEGVLAEPGSRTVVAGEVRAPVDVPRAAPAPALAPAFVDDAADDPLLRTVAVDEAALQQRVAAPVTAARPHTAASPAYVPAPAPPAPPAPTRAAPPAPSRAAPPAPPAEPTSSTRYKLVVAVGILFIPVLLGLLFVARARMR